MGSMKSVDALGETLVPRSVALHAAQTPALSPASGGLVRSYAGSTAVSLEFVSSHELGSAVSIDFFFMTLTHLVHIFRPPSLFN